MIWWLRLIDLFIYWLIAWLTAWLFDRLDDFINLLPTAPLCAADRLTDWFIHWLTGRLTDRLFNGWLTSITYCRHHLYMCDWSIYFLTDCLIDRLTHWLFDQLVDFINLLPTAPLCAADQFIYWLPAWLTDWLTDYLIGWLTSLTYCRQHLCVRLVDWQTDGQTNLFTDCLTDWQIDYLIGWLTN